MADSQPEVFDFSDAGDATETGRSRSSVKVRLHGSDRGKLWEGRLLTAELKSILVEAEDPPPLEDMPWADGSGRMVSDRLRTLLEQHAPGEVEFIPMKLMYKRSIVRDPVYWMANFLHVVDCIDRTLSNYEEVPDRHQPDGVRLSINKLVIRLSAIPQDVSMCRVYKYEPLVLIRRQLREVLGREGITGPQYYSVEQV